MIFTHLQKDDDTDEDNARQARVGGFKRETVKKKKKRETSVKKSNNCNRGCENISRTAKIVQRQTRTTILQILNKETIEYKEVHRLFFINYLFHSQ